MISPNRAFARLLIGAFAAGPVFVVTVLLLFVGGIASISGLRTDWCVTAPASFLDWVLHSSAFGVWLLMFLPVLIALRTASRERAVGAKLGAATRAARLPSVPSNVSAIAEFVGIVDDLDLVEAYHPFAFVYGWMQPRICVSTGLVERLSDRELEAVLHHEQWHLKRRDPVRLLIVRMIAAAFVFFPTIRRLARHYRLATEIAADRHAVSTMGSQRWLASALSKLVGNESPTGMVAFVGLAEARIAALAGELPADRGQLHRGAILVLLGELAIISTLVMRGGASLSPGLWPYSLCC